MIGHKLQTAIDKRSGILGGDTNALRLIDGEGDGLPGVYLDTFAERWLLATRESIIEPEIRSWLEQQGKRGRTVYWKQLDQHEKTSPVHIAGPAQDEPFTATESGVHYRINFQAGYSQGIFLDQRLNRQRVRAESGIGKGVSKGVGKAILNTFAYTGAFSVAAALAGATTTTLDLSQVYLD